MPAATKASRYRSIVIPPFPRDRELYHLKAPECQSAASRRRGPVMDIDAAFVVKDSGGQKLAYVYFEDEPGTFRSAIQQ